MIITPPRCRAAGALVVIAAAAALSGCSSPTAPATPGGTQAPAPELSPDLSPDLPGNSPAGTDRPADSTQPSKEAKPMLQHEQVTHAVAATGDRELASWVADRAEYTIAPVAMAELKHHHLFRIMPDGTSHPMSFLIAAATDSMDAMVTTSNPEALAVLLAKEPDLAKSPALAERVFALIREQSRRQKLLTGPDDLPAPLRTQNLPVTAPVVEQNAGSWSIRLSVLDGAGLLQTWAISLPAEGTATLSRNTIADNLDVGDLGGP